LADLSAIRSLVLEVNQLAHGVDVVVTRPAPDNDPIETRGIWLTPLTEDVPIGMDFQRREPIRVIALSRLAVPTVPRGTVIVAPEKAGDDDEEWLVDGVERVEADHSRVTVRRIET
jgi:hypothetical protein